MKTGFYNSVVVRNRRIREVSDIDWDNPTGVLVQYDGIHSVKFGGRQDRQLKRYSLQLEYFNIIDKGLRIHKRGRHYLLDCEDYRLYQ